MILLDKNNCRVQTLWKSPDSVSAPKSRFYADLKVCLALEGEAVWEIGERSYQILPGDIVLLNIGQKRQFTAFGENGFKLCAFVLTRSAFTRSHHFMYFLHRVKSNANLLRNSALSPLLKEAYDGWKAESPFRYELASAKLTEFFIKAEIAEQSDWQSFSREDMEMLEMMDYIDEHITAPISLRAAAHKAGMSDSSFSRKFSAWNGISFKQYVTEKKIQNAICLLQTTRMKVIDVATESGFDSISGFYDAFQKKTGTTPGKFAETDDE